jgi:hypothetical protein
MRVYLKCEPRLYVDSRPLIDLSSNFTPRHGDAQRGSRIEK